MKMLFPLMFLIVVLSGCGTLGNCEALAIREERRQRAFGKEVYRVHYFVCHSEASGFDILHAINYEIQSNGSRRYYDVELNRNVEAPADDLIRYDSGKDKQ